jgi:hypothetical protein
VISGLLADGELGGGSRIFQWGWNPMHKMAKGGKTNEMMKSMGRGMAKVANQRGK